MDIPISGEPREFDSTMSRPGVVTIWFVSVANPIEVLNEEPDYDRGFGRKYLAFYDSTLPITPIGDFPLNRSAAAGRGEFYIGGYPGLAIVQTVIDDVSRLSALPERFRTAVAATDIYAYVEDPDSGFGAFAHWRAGELKRAFSATAYRILEDEGLPSGAEGDYWAGKFAPTGASSDDASSTLEARSQRSFSSAGVKLPFVPAALAHAVITDWLGFDPADPGPDIPVSGFAVDGRKVPIAAHVSTAGQRVLATDTNHQASDSFDYDDYEDHYADDTGDLRSDVRRAGQRAAGLGARFGKAVGSAAKKLKNRFSSK